MKKIKSKAPDTFLIIFSIIVITAALTWIIPGGSYDTREIKGREVVIPESFHRVESNPQNADDVLMAPLRGFVEASLIIGFVLIVGGAFGVFQKTEAVDSAILAVAKAHKKSPVLRALLIPIFMTIFSFAGAVFGMSEEIIPFILVFVPMALMLGYDTITGIAIPFLGAGAGFAGAFLNPFTIGIAQGIAEIPLFSGIEYRILVWFVTTSLAIIFVSRHAAKIKKNPEKSPTYERDQEKRKNIKFEALEKFDGLDRSHKISLILFLLALLTLVVGVIEFKWFIEEISGVFLITGILVGVVSKLSIKEITSSFVEGAKALVSTALVIALARGILVVASDGRIIDTILFHLSGIVGQFHPIVSGQAMFFVQTAINFFVPSGSGQAALTMPIMAPLADLVGVSRQTAVLAFQMGDGFTNMIIPTSAVTMGVLTLAEAPWEKWARWLLPLEIIFFIVGCLLLIPPYLIGWQ